MMQNMLPKTSALRWMLMLTAMLASSANVVRAQEEDEPNPEARLVNFESDVRIKGGTALMYLLSIGLAAAVVGVMFKNANRSHLD